MFIRNGKRFNIHASAEIDGVRYPNFTNPGIRAKLDITEIPDPVRESEETHYVQEIDDPPYVVNTPKPAAIVKELRRAKRKQRVDEDRDAALAAGFEFGGVRWHGDIVFQAQMTSYVLAFNVGILPADATVPVRSVDNVTHQMGVTQITDLAAALLNHVQGIFVASWAAKDAPE